LGRISTGAAHIATTREPEEEKEERPQTKEETEN